MNLHKKTSIENQKSASEKKLSIRLKSLKSQGLDDRRIQRDAKIKQYRAEVRAAKKRLVNIATIENLIIAKAETKARKLESLKTAPPPEKKAAASQGPRKPKKEKKRIVQDDVA